MTLILPAAPATRFGHRLMRMLRRLLVLLRRRTRRTRRVLELSRLDERLLYDLGIDPLEVRQAILDKHNQIGLVRLARRLGNRR